MTDMKVGHTSVPKAYVEHKAIEWMIERSKETNANYIFPSK